MRAILLPVFAALVLWLPGAQAQTEDEEILEESADAPSPRQSKRDEELDDEDLDAQVFYSGMGIERVSTDFDNLGEATNLAAVLGFRVPTFPWVGLEIDIAQTIIPGENDNTSGSDTTCPPLDPFCTPTAGTTADTDEFAMQALGLSLVFKTRGRFYFSGRYGYRYLATSIDELNEDRSHSGPGVGVGYRWGKGLSGVELGYKELGKDVEAIGLTFFVRTGAGR